MDAQLFHHLYPKETQISMLIDQFLQLNMSLCVQAGKIISNQDKWKSQSFIALGNITSQLVNK
jgi:hypothetical protein